MGMYSSMEGADISSSTRAGLPNVSQYGWSSYEVEEYKQLIEYVDEAKNYRDEIVQKIEYMEVLYQSVLDTKVLIEKLYTDLVNKSVQIEAWFKQIELWKVIIEGYIVQIDAKYADIERWHQECLDIRDHVDAIKTEIDTIRAAILISEANAEKSATDSATSASKSEEFYNKSYELYLDLKQGQVYRGAWNPNSGSYPAHQNTNSVWDVVLNKGQEEVSFDNKRWFWGDRLFYSITDSSYYQIESGTVVKSVNGRTGAVIITSEEIGAVNRSGDTMSGKLSVPTGFSVGGVDVIGADTTAVRIGSSGSTVETHITAKDGKVYIDDATSSNRVYHQGYKPTASELNVYTKLETDNKITDIAYTKNEIDTKLEKKSDKTYTDTQLNLKADKSTTINTHPLSGDIILTPSDVGALSSSGGDLDGNILLSNSAEVYYKGSTFLGNAAKGVVYTNQDGNVAGRFGIQWNPLLNGVPTNFYVGGNQSPWSPGDSTNWLSVAPGGVIQVDGGKRVYHQGFKPSYTDVGAADMENSAEITLLKNSNESRTKLVKIHSKEGRLYAVASDGSVSQFYNDKSYKPTLADFGGLGVENGNELNFPSNKSDFYFGYRKNGTEVGTYHFANGKAQLNQYATIKAEEFYAQGDKRVYHQGFKPTAADVGAVSKAGDTMTGTLTTTGIQINTTSTSAQGVFITAPAPSVHFMQGVGGASGYIGMEGSGKDALYVRTPVEAIRHKIYHQGYKPTTADVGALPLSGGTMAGLLRFDDTIQFKGRGGSVDLNSLTSETAGYWGYGSSIGSASANIFPISNNANGVLYFNTHEGKFARQIGFSSNGAMYNRFRDGSNWSNWRKIYDEGNKPTTLDIRSVDPRTRNISSLQEVIDSQNKEIENLRQMILELKEKVGL